MVTPAARREAVAQLRVVHEVSERRACSALGADRTPIRYRGSRPDDAAVRGRLRELAAVRRRFGYRRLHILLTREGIVMNHKKLRRLYREERLQVRRRGGRKRALGTRAPMTLPQGPNQRWSHQTSKNRIEKGSNVGPSHNAACSTNGKSHNVIKQTPGPLLICPARCLKYFDDGHTSYLS
jgi:transposase InsO family protein